MAADEPRQIEPQDGELAEEWIREAADSEVGFVDVVRWREGETWQVTVAAMEYVRSDPLESEIRQAMAVALAQVPGVDEVAEEDREVWSIEGQTNGRDLTSAAARVVDFYATRVRDYIDAL